MGHEASYAQNSVVEYFDREGLEMRPHFAFTMYNEEEGVSDLYTTEVFNH